VEKDGTITQAEVKRSPNDLLSEEALRVVKLMPKWEPGKVGGKPVRSVFNLPVMFKRFP
jgi:protein TonB